MLAYIERRLTFKPNRDDHGALDTLTFERFRLGAEFGLDLDAGFVDHRSSIVVLFLHGNKHNITRFADHYRLFDTLGWSYLFFDYPGYGESSGVPSEAGVYAAARSAYSHLRHERGYRPEQILVYGCSMGGAVAIELLTHVRARALVTESTFTCSWDMARHLYPALPIWPLMPNRFRNNVRIASLSLPLLIIHGSADRVVPVGMAHDLFARANGPKDLLIVEGSNHVDCIHRAHERVAERIDVLSRLGDTASLIES